MNDKKKARIFRSLEEENQAERRRRAQMTPHERWQELSVLQARRWGPDWATKPMTKTATWEEVDW